jgi:hypothetical protein
MNVFKSPKKIVGLGIVTLLTLAGCGLKKDDSAGSSQPSVLSKPNACLEPSIFKFTPGREVSFAELKASTNGAFEMQEVHLHYSGSALEGKQTAALSARIVRSKGIEVPIDLQVDCREVKGNQVFVGVRFYVPTIVHFPSTRITIFDEGGQLDNPSYNFPRMALIKFGLKPLERTEMYQDQPKEKIGEAPFEKNLYFSEAMNFKDKQVQFFIHEDGLGFDVKFSTNEPSTVPAVESKSAVLVRYR